MNTANLTSHLKLVASSNLSQKVHLQYKFPLSKLTMKKCLPIVRNFGAQKCMETRDARRRKRT